MKLHVGSGGVSLPGWVNIDIRALPGVDVVLDASASLPFTDAEAIFAEHFLEHLRVDRALAFLERAHRALAPRGLIRLSTPNLDWVLLTHYPEWATGEQRASNALLLNRAFHGWGHQFAWNLEALEVALTATGFVEIRSARWGESAHDLFRGLERHEPYADHPKAHHLLVVEARKGEAQPALLARIRETLRTEYLAHLDPIPDSVAGADD